LQVCTCANFGGGDFELQPQQALLRLCCQRPAQRDLFAGRA
jgi:hypothetical protein